MCVMSCSTVCLFPGEEGTGRVRLREMNDYLALLALIWDWFGFRRVFFLSLFFFLFADEVVGEFPFGFACFEFFGGVLVCVVVISFGFVCFGLFCCLSVLGEEGGGNWV